MHDIWNNITALDFAAEAVAEYLEEQQLDPFVPMAHSTGAIVALKTTLKHPDLVDGIASSMT